MISNIWTDGMNLTRIIVPWMMLLAICCGAELSGGESVVPTAEVEPRLLRDLACGQEYLLNGLYRFRLFRHMPSAADVADVNGFRMRIPGVWVNFLGQSDQLTTADGKVCDKFPFPDGMSAANAELYGLYQNEFTLPPPRRGQTVLLNVSGCRSYGEVYFNGKKLGNQYTYDNCYYNITSDAEAGGRKTLKIALRPFAPEALPFGDKPGWSRRVANGGIMNDVRLLYLNLPLLVHLRYIKTDVDKKSALVALRVENFSGRSIAGCRVSLQVSRHGRVVTGGAGALTAKAGNSSMEIDLPLRGVELWDAENPVLYDFALRVSAGGKEVDLPVFKSGFREIKLSAGNLLINGVPRFLGGESGSRLNLLMSECNGIYPEQILRNYRALGLNFANVLDFPTNMAVAEAADSLGFYLGPVVRYDADTVFRNHAAFPGLTSLGAGQIPPEEMAIFYRQFAALAERYARHPSVIGYARMFNWLCDSEKAYNPHLAGRREHATDERTLFAEKVLRATTAIDPTRLNYLHHGGGRGPIYTHNRYWGAGVPLAEKGDFARLWAEDKSPDKMPFWVTEATLFPAWPSLYPKWGASPRNGAWRGLGSPYAIREYAAITLGTAAYLLPTDEKSIRAEHKNNILREIGALRHYGVMGHMMHTDSYSAYAPGVIVPSTAKLGDNVAGFVSNSKLWSNQHPSTKINDLGRVMRQAFSGCTFFIGGAADNPTALPHNFYGGEKLARSLMFFNNSGAARQGRLLVTLKPTVIRREMKISLPPGEKKIMPLDFVLPQVPRRTDCRLEVEMSWDNGEFFTQCDNFALYSVARPVARTGDRKIAVYDPHDTLKPLLQYFNITPVKNLAQAGSLDGVDMILVGRNALGIHFSTVAGRLKLADFLRRGGNVVVFEQPGEKLADFTLDMRRARQVFGREAAEDITAGIGPDDLAAFRGKSSLLQAFPPPGGSFHWSVPLVSSVDNIVASFAIEKPHKGNFIALLECGYDLQFTPLLQVREGRGSVYFCQLDLTERIGVDPAGTLLCGNLLQAAARAAGEPRELVWCGAPDEAVFLRKLGREYTLYRAGTPLAATAVLAIGRGGDKVLNREQLGEFLRRGGTVLVCPGAPLALLPVAAERVTLKSDRFFAAGDKLPVGKSDLYFHSPIKLEGVRFPQMGNVNPIVGEFACGGGRVVYCRVPLEVAGNELFGMKPYRLWSELLTKLDVLSRRYSAAAMLERAGNFETIALGNSADFRLDPKKCGIAENWHRPETVFPAAFWDKIVVPGAWEKTPLLKNFGPPNPPAAAPGYDGTAFYRFRIFVPEYLRGRECVLNIGVIDDYDTVYVNGRRVGGMGKAFGNTYAMNRAYRVKGDVLRYGADNIIVVRVDDPAGEGGIMHGKMRLEFSVGKRGDDAGSYMAGKSIFEVLGVSPYYNEQW